MVIDLLVEPTDSMLWARQCEVQVSMWKGFPSLATCSGYTSAQKSAVFFFLLLFIYFYFKFVYRNSGYCNCQHQAKPIIPQGGSLISFYAICLDG